MSKDITNLVINEFLEWGKSKRDYAEVGIPAQLPLYDIPYWPEAPKEPAEEKKKEKNNNIYEGDDVFIIEMNHYI